MASADCSSCSHPSTEDDLERLGARLLVTYSSDDSDADEICYEASLLFKYDDRTGIHFLLTMHDKELEIGCDNVRLAGTRPRIAWFGPVPH